MDYNFKPGDKVVCIIPDGVFLKKDGVYTFLEYDEEVEGFLLLKGFEEKGFFMALRFKLYVEEPSSPIRERTVKELCPGVYGKFSINQDEKQTVKIAFDKFGDPEYRRFDAQELRAAADVFKTLADYLEGKE